MPNPWDKYREGPTVERANAETAGSVPGPWERDWSGSSAPVTAPEQPASASRGPLFDTLDAFNDTLTFGLYSKLLEGTGIRPGETDRIEAMRRENPLASIIGDLGGYAIPGAGLAAGTAKTIPALARNTIPSIMGREAVAGGGLTIADNALRHGEFSFLDTALDAGMSGAMGGAFGVLSRVNPTERLRAAGSHLSDADLAAARQFHDTAEGVGIPLNNMEAITAVAPGPGSANVQGHFASALQSPKGGVAGASFEASRGPVIRDTAEQMVQDLGGGVAPFDVSQAAGQSVENLRMQINAAARPHYAAAEARHLPPTWVPKHPYIEQATRNITSNEGLMADLTREYQLATGRSGPMPTHSIMFNDAVKKELQRMANEAAEKGNNMVATGIGNQVENMITAMDRVAPSYAQARQITEDGAQVIAGLNAGPIGSLSAGGTAAGQGDAVFGVRTGADADVSREALANLGSIDTEMPRGILANHLDAAVSDVTVPPTTFAQRALPTTHSMDLAEDALGGASPLVNTRLEAARAIDPYGGAPLMEPSGTTPRVMSMDLVKDAGKGRAVDMMYDPNFMGRFIPDGQGGSTFERGQLGRPGPTLERAINMGRSTVAADGPSDWMDEEEKRRLRIQIMLEEMGITGGL